MKIILLFLVLIAFIGCERDDSKILESLFMKANHSKFKGFTIYEFGGKGCLVRIKSANGNTRNFHDLRRPKRILKGTELIGYDLIEFCRKHNIYYYKNSENSILAKTNNSYYSYYELKSKDTCFFYKRLEELNDKKFFKEKLSIAFLVNPKEMLFDSLKRETTLYANGDSSYYFWQFTPELLECRNCLIHD